ncbi:MAG: phosphonoacetaldehyde hydrolase [Pseudomonadota bacterium]|nr:phosphonoacetaldehyde hydrolase [Pseudomonadota bacterium]
MSGVKAVIFDWAGTLVDYGSRAPMGAFVETFAEFGVVLTIAEARGPMGMAKRPHIAALCALPRVRAAWAVRYGAPPTEADIDALYNVFVPKNIAVAAAYADAIPGAAETLATLKAHGIKIGSSTGYTREIMAQILPRARAQGIAPDSLVCTGDTPEGRPSPLMLWRGLIDLDVWPASAAVKVDDTIVGVEEGINAGAWSVGVAVSGNGFGASHEEVRAMPAPEFARRREAAYEALIHAGAHYVVDSVADLLPVIAQIEARLASGERP